MNYFFLGIGGIGMSAIARYLHRCGHTVAGYDLTPSPLTAQLSEEGISVSYDDDASIIPHDVDTFIYTPAVPSSTTVFQIAKESGKSLLKRSEVLGLIANKKRCIAVAGTHGKTSTSSMIAHILASSHIGCSAFLGGISKNFNSNLYIDDSSEYIVVEADEFDHSFLQLKPFYSVITSVDPDHLDVYGDYAHLQQAFLQFANQTSPNGKLFLKQDVSLSPDENENHDEHHDEYHSHSHNHDELNVPLISYTAHGIEANYYPWNIRTSRGNIYYDLRTPNGVLFDIELHRTALYNVENSVAAAAVALECGVSEHELRYGLKTYDGVKRRFDYRAESNGITYIDDYAHHPKEIAATIESIRFLYPNKRIVGIFQPHLFSRTADFADDFAKALSSLDETILLPIYPAREKPIPGVSSGMILRKMDTLSKYLVSKEQLLDLIPALYPDVLVTLGAGDIDRLVPQIEQLVKSL